MIEEPEKTFKAVSFLKAKWDNPLVPTILVLFVFIGGGILAYNIDIFDVPSQISQAEWVLIVGVSILFLFGWFASSRPRKTLAGKIGIVIAIACETEKEEVRLRADFVDALREKIVHSNRKQFDVYELSQYHARKCQSVENAIRYLKDTHAHLIIFGRCRLRNHRGKSTYMVDFQEAIRHAEVPSEVSQQLKQDMQLAFPTRMLFPEQNELEGFEATKEIFGIASQFTLGIASLLSGDPLTAFDLHHSAFRETHDRLEVDDNSLVELKRFKARLAECLVLSGLHATRVYYKNKSDGYLDKMARYLDVVQEIDPGNYDAHLVRAICLFLQNEDIEGARQEIKKAKNERNAAWQYSEAFLVAYEGRLEEAHKIYKRAFKGVVAEETPLDVEEFIGDVLARRPDKIQLWYCLGMINYFLKADLQAGEKDFLKFLKAAAPQGAFPISVDFAKKYLLEIEDKLGRGKSSRSY